MPSVPPRTRSMPDTPSRRAGSAEPMSLPFRRRHHDDETAHDRARTLWSTAMLEALDASDAGWLDSLASPKAVPSALAVNTAQLAWVQPGSEGSYQLLLADIDEVCPDPKAGCAPLRNKTESALTLGSRPEAIVGSPSNDQLVVVS